VVNQRTQSELGTTEVYSETKSLKLLTSLEIFSFREVMSRRAKTDPFGRTQVHCPWQDVEKEGVKTV